MAEKHIFIGLGGAGVNTVTTIKYKIYEKLIATRHKSRIDQLNDDYRFLFIDTDSRDINANNEKYRDRYEYGKVDFIDPANELIDLGDQNPKQIYEEALKEKNIQINKRVLEACDASVAAKMPNIRLTNGASAFRIKSRIAFARKSLDFTRKLRTCITDLNSLAGGAITKNDCYYWIVSSSNGGTGSGIVNDVLYYVNMIHKQVINSSDPHVVLTMYMPQYYIDMNSSKDKYPRNAYAVLSEIEAFQCMAKEKKEDVLSDFHRLALIRDYNQFDTTESYCPFTYCIPIDYQTDKDTNMGSVTNMYYNTAELLYYIHGKEGGEALRSTSNNYIYDTQSRSSKSFLIPMGYIALRKPEKDFEDYMMLRMKYELLRYGVIGEKIETLAERKAISDAFYNNVVARALFSDANSVKNILKSMVDNRIEEELPDSLIMEGGKVSKKRPEGVSTTEAEALILGLQQRISGSRELKDNALNAIEKALWKWVEDNVALHGLEYVDMSLLALDGKCTELYNDFSLDRKGQMSRRRVLQNEIDEQAVSLENLYEKAERTTPMERISGKNSEDVLEFFTSLKKFVSKRTDLMIEEQAFEVMKDLCDGDSGIIDKIRRYVANMLSEAYSLLSKDNGTQAAYEYLAKSFLEKGRDVTSVYLPDIQSFTDSMGWKENHRFSVWYSLIINPTNKYEQGKGFVPVRSGSMGSLEYIMREVKNVNRELLNEKGYINNDGDSTFFSNGNNESIKKSLSDFMFFASQTFETIYKSNTKIQDEWFTKKLSRFFNELDPDARRDIRGLLSPSLFFTYNQERENDNEAIRNIYVAEDKELAEEIFGYKPNDSDSAFISTDIPSMMYMIKTKIGLSFDYYRTYETIKREYEKMPRKEEYHFHSAFARCNGDYKNIVMPKEFEPQLISFVRYMLMDGYRDVLSAYYHSSPNAFDRENFSNTPFVMEENRVLIASKNNITKRGENVCLNIRNGEHPLYSSLVFGSVDNPYKVVYEKFKSIYVIEMLEAAIEGLIKDMSWIARNTMETNYANVWQTLIGNLDSSIAGIKSREERTMVSGILEALTTELDTFDKFLSR